MGSFSGQTGTEFDQASTLAHEFGHNLGLAHCGSMNCDVDDSGFVGNYTPNLPSTMSYRYQLAGVRNNMLFNNLAPAEALFKNIDYSHGSMCSLNEDNLNEFFGTGMVATDWNCNGGLQLSVAQDITGGGSGWCGAMGSTTLLHDLNEWATIGDPGPLAGEPEEVSCITAEEWELVKQELAIAGGASQPDLTVEACIGGKNVYVGPLSMIPVGTCTFPHTSVQTAHDFSPDGSVFFLMPGTYNESGIVTLDKPGTYMCNIGTATVQ
jgi:hypothetical protein